MPAYVIAEIEVHDQKRYEEYKRQAPATIAAHGGRYRARGGEVELLEGSRPAARSVILEFPDAAAARRWWSSEEYMRIRGIREQSARSRILLLEPPPDGE